MNQSSVFNADGNVVHITSNLKVIAVLAVFASMETTFVVLSNVTVVVAVVWSRMKGHSNNDNNITKLLMASMACVDVLLGAVHMPVNVLQLVDNGQWILGAKFCNLFHGISNVLCGANTCHILCIAMDKYLAFCKPLLYRLLSKRIGRVMVIISWTLPSLMFLLPLATDWFGTRAGEMLQTGYQIKICSPVYNKNILIFLYILVFYLPILASYILYARIFCEIWNFNKRKHLYARNKTQPNVSSEVGHFSNIFESAASNSNKSSKYSSFSRSINSENKQPAANSSSNFHGKGESSGRISRNIRAIRTLGAIIISFTICWTPVWILTSVYVYYDFKLPFGYIFLSGWFAYMNSAINPVLCSFFKPIRKAMKHLLCNVK